MESAIALMEKTKLVAVRHTTFKQLQEIINSLIALRPDSPCMISQFECPQLGDISGNSSVTECIPLAHRCNGNRDCANSGDEIGCCELIRIYTSII